jgi:hypothetical protein
MLHVQHDDLSPPSPSLLNLPFTSELFDAILGSICTASPNIFIQRARRKGDNKFNKLAKYSRKNLLERNRTLPENSFQNCEVLVGITASYTFPKG